MPKEQTANANFKAINHTSCILYHVKEVFYYFLPLLYWGINVYEKLNVGGFSIHCFIIFKCIFKFFT